MWRHNSSADVKNNNKDDKNTNEEDKLPPGWTKKESKSQKGRFYYISPQGKTQWVPPVPKSYSQKIIQKEYKWVTEVEIEFGEGRLGVSLREVKQMDGIPYQQFQAEVDDLPKINGKAGPAEIYNWSVKPHQRLTIGMRVTAIEDVSLAGMTYKDVVDRLKKASRPVKIKFADVEKGTLEDNPDAAAAAEKAQEDGPTGQSSMYLQQKQEYTRVLVTSELHAEMWTIENKKLMRSMQVLKKKWETVSSEFDALNTHRMELRQENERLKNDKDKYETMIKHLKLQEIHAMENPEFVKANELAKRNTELTEDITKMSAGNKRLRKERVTLQQQLDELESQLAKVEKKGEEEDKAADEDLVALDPNAPPEEQLAVLKKRYRIMEDELNKEQRKAARVQREMEQLNKHLASLTVSSSSSSSSSPSLSSSKSKADEHGSAAAAKAALSTSGNGSNASSPEIAALEAKILELRKKQRSVVETLSKAAQSGDQQLAKECQRKRHAIKEELKHAQDALHNLKTQGSSTYDKERSSGDRAGGDKGEKNDKSSVRSSDPKSSSSSKTLSRQRTKADKIPTMTGFLDKGPTEWAERGLIKNMKTMRGARERWCEITPDGFLKYYKRRGDPVVRGEIDLSDKSFEVVCEDMTRGKEFVLSTETQQSRFYTKSPQELAAWVKALRAANAYLVTNKQLDALVGKVDAADKNSRGGAGGSSMPEEDEQFYGRATLGF